MIRFTIYLFFGLVSIFQSQGRDFYGDDGRQAMLEAVTAAIKGDDLGIHSAFIATYVRASLPYFGGEDLESISLSLGFLLYKCGDKRFSEVLKIERPEVVSAVKAFLSPDSKTFSILVAGPDQKSAPWKKYPKSTLLLSEAIDIPFAFQERSPQFQEFRRLLKD